MRRWKQHYAEGLVESVADVPEYSTETSVAVRVTLRRPRSSARAESLPLQE